MAEDVDGWKNTRYQSDLDEEETLDGNSVRAVVFEPLMILMAGVWVTEV